MQLEDEAKGYGTCSRASRGPSPVGSPSPVAYESKTPGWLARRSVGRRGSSQRRRRRRRAGVGLGSEWPVKKQGSWRELARGEEEARLRLSLSGGRGSENKRCGAAWVGGEWSSCRLPLLPSPFSLSPTRHSAVAPIPFSFYQSGKGSLYSRVPCGRDKTPHMNQAYELNRGPTRWYHKIAVEKHLNLVWARGVIWIQIFNLV
jgi:hypothetical protein